MKRSSLFVLLLLIGCSSKKKEGPTPVPPAGESKFVYGPVKTSPCAADKNCQLWLDPCDCSCTAVTELPKVSNEQWSKQCGDNSPGRNCGVASPCMNKVATCDVATKTCKLH